MQSAGKRGHTYKYTFNFPIVHMPEFESEQIFDHFRNEVLKRRRFVREEKAQKFLDALASTAEDRTINLKSGECLWRAQNGSNTKKFPQQTPGGGTTQVEKEVCLSKDRMTPHENMPTVGRVDPKGISCLYTASDEQTAVTEVRPWVGARVTVATLQTTCDLKLVDCTNGKFTIALGEMSDEEVDEAVWEKINRAFSTPVSDQDDTTQYAPTQIIAEVFKEQGYDGIVYKSSLGEGENVVLFDIESAKVDSTKLIQVESVNVEFEPERGWLKQKFGGM